MGSFGEQSQILLVDDDMDALEEMRDGLEMQGFTAHLAGSGEEALALARKVRPEVVIIDFLLPGINGLDTIEAMHEFIPCSEYLMITGYPEFCRGVTNDCSKGFFVAEKPISLGSIVHYLKNLMP